MIIHVILGLPHETPSMMLQTIDSINQMAPFGVKLQLLHVLKNTDLADYYLQGNFEVLTKEAYLNLVISCLEHLSPDIVVHRVTGDGPKELLLAPTWSCHKRDVLNSLHQLMRDRNTRQGAAFY